MTHSLRSTTVLSLLTLTGLTSAATAQTIAYDGFSYPPSASLIGQAGGSGFSSPWQSAGYGDWTGDSHSLYRLKVWQLMAGQSGSARSSNGGLQRSLTTPIAGTAGTSVWISFIARHSGPSTNSWLGVKLPCSGPGADPFLFIGKPFGQPNWGADNGSPGGVRQSSSSVVDQTRCVCKIDFHAGGDDVTVWLDPDFGVSPPLASAALTLPAYGNFADLRKVLIETGSTGGAVQNAIDEVRLGATYADVTPVAPGIMFDGLQHVAMGGATVAPSPDGSKLVVSNIGSSGNDGVEINWHSVQGGGVVYGDSGVPNAPGSSCRQKYKGWDGTIKGVRTSVTNSDGSMTHTFDYSSMGASSVSVSQYDETGNEVSNVNFAGGLATVMAPPICPTGSQFPFKVWYDVWVDGTHFLGYYCNDPIHPIGMIKVTPNFPPGTNPDMKIETMQITAQGMPELVFLPPGVAVRESPTRCCRNGQSYRSMPTASGLGDVVLTEECDDGGGSCTGQDERKLVANNIGSSGQDGVEIKWRTAQTSTSGNVNLGDIRSEGEASIVLKSLFGSSGTVVTTGELHLQGMGDHAEVRPDFSGVGSTEFEVIGYLNGAIVTQGVYPNGTPIDVGTEQVICGPGRQIVWGWVTELYWNPWPVQQSVRTYWGVVGCMTVGTGSGGSPTNTDRIVFAPVNPVISAVTEVATVTARRGPKGWIELDSVSFDTVHLCAADFDGDGTVDFFDYDAYVNCFEGHGCPAGRTADFDGDGAEDFFDYDAFVQAFEAPC